MSKQHLLGKFIAVVVAVSTFQVTAQAQVNDQSGTDSNASSTSTQESNETQLEEIVVSGVRAAAAAAQDIKRNSAFVVDAIVAEDIGKLPDNSVAEALARVAGIQIRRDAGEANSVLIRGLPNVVTLLNGREVFTTRDRFIALGDVPANVLQRVDIYKSSGASHIEGGIAGTIDIITRSAFDNPGLQMDANIRGAYNDKAESWNPNIGATVSNTWDLNDGGEFGALLGLSYINTKYHEERAFNVESVDQSGFGGAWDAANGNPPPVTPLLAPFVMGYIPIAGDRTRTAANFELMWRPDDDTELYFEGFVTDFRDEFELDFFVGLPLLGDGQATATLYPGTNILHTLQNNNVFTIMSTQANDNSTLTQQYAFGGSKRLGRLYVSTDLAYTTSEHELINPILDASIVVPEVFVNTNAGGTAQLNYGGPGFDITTDEGFALENWFDNHRKDNGDAIDWRVDAELIDFANEHIDAVSFGIRVAQRTADSIGGVPGGTGPAPGGRLISEFPGLGCVSEAMASGGPDYVMTEWFTPCADYLLNNTATIREAFTGTTERKPYDPGTFFDIKESTVAAYGQVDLIGELGSMPWSAVLGVRVVKTEQELTGNVAQDNDADGILDYTPIAIDNNSTDVLPSLNAKLSITDEIIGRFSYSKALTRPNFLDLNPGVSLSTIVSNTTGLTGEGGNPNLKPVESDNFDLSAEWYFAEDAFLTATYFYRDFEGYIQPTVQEVNFFGDSYRVTRPGNTGDGKLKGIEIGYQQFFDNLPGVFSGLGMQVNYTYMEGDTTNLDTGESLSITGLSEQSYNIVLLYERDRLSGRLAYNWRDEFLDVRNIAAGYDLYVAETKQLDGQISYELNDNLTLSFEAINILDTEFKDFFVDPENPQLTGLFPRDTRRYDRSFVLGLRASF